MRLRCGVLTTAVVIAACGPSQAAPARQTSSACGPSTAHTLAASGTARVYSAQGVVYGCSSRTGHKVRLGQSTTCIGRQRITHVRVVAALAGYGAETCGVDTGSSVVVVRRLSDGKVLVQDAANSGFAGPESYGAVDSLVLKGDGAVAWIAVARSIVGHGEVIEVHAATSAGERLLESGAGIDPTSLRLHRSTLTWTDGGERRQATLR